jgi:hypothetical protein
LWNAAKSVAKVTHITPRYKCWNMRQTNNKTRSAEGRLRHTAEIFDSTVPAGAHFNCLHSKSKDTGAGK